MFTLAQGPSILMPRMECRNSSGSSLAATIFRKGALGVGIREHDAGPNLGAIFQYYATSSAVADIDLRHWSGGANFDSELSSRRRQRLGDRAHAAHDVSVEALQFVLAATQQMKEQADGRARLIRSAMFAIDVIGQEHGFHFFGFVIVIEKFAQAPGQERNQLRDLSARNPAESLAHAKQVGPAAHAAWCQSQAEVPEKTVAGSAPASSGDRPPERKFPHP